MNKGRMYITLNRNREWKRSLLLNLEPQEHRLVFAHNQENDYGMLATAVMITGSIDSTEPDFQWESLWLDAQMPENSLVKGSCYAANSKAVLLDEGAVDLDEYIRTAQSDPAQGLKAAAPLFSLAFTGATDGLLPVQGRYLWLRLEFLVPQPSEFALRKIKLLLTDEKIIQYLPEIYRDDQENNFFKRFMEIFDSIFFDIEEQINRLSEQLDYTLAEEDMLRYLARWVDLQGIQDMGTEELRERIRTIMPEYRAIGTKPGLTDFIRRELGVQPQIIEYFDYKQMQQESKDRDIYRELFGDNPFKFFILLPEEALQQVKNLDLFLAKLKSNIPAHTEAGIIRLKQGTILGKHTYLGVNSLVGEYTYGRVGGNNELSYDTLMGGTGNEE